MMSGELLGLAGAVLGAALVATKGYLEVYGRKRFHAKRFFDSLFMGIVAGGVAGIGVGDFLTGFSVGMAVKLGNELYDARTK